METFHLGGKKVPRLFVGLWQLASPQWGSANAAMQDQGLSRLVENGFVAADMADHYGDAELVYGDFRLRMPPEVQPAIYAATKWCVFRDIGRAVTPDWVLNQVEERCRRLSGRADLLQFHWHDVSTSTLNLLKARNKVMI
jgi:aryl-alcohol dehydrogenase-like predicted oxidoreductase